MTKVRSCRFTRSAAIRRLIVLAGLAGMLATAPPAATSSASAALVTIGEGSSPGLGLPSVKVELLPGSSGTSSAGVTLDGGGVTVTTPVTPPVTVPVPKVELTTPAPSTPVSTPTPEGGTTEASGGTGGGGSSSGPGGSGSGSASVASAASTAVGSATFATGAQPTQQGDGELVDRAAPVHHGARRHHTDGQGATFGVATSTNPATPQGRSGDGPAATSGFAAKHTSHRDTPGGPLASLGRDLPVPLPVPDWSKPIILLLALLALGFALRWGLVSRRARRLDRDRRALLRDIDVMQAALVPEVPARLGGLEMSVAYRPAEGPAAGGDFYEVFEPDEGRVAVVLGDVAGHGHDAVRQAALTRYTLRAYLKETGDPRAALALAGRTLSEPGVQQLATVAIAVYDSTRGTLTYALAGHPPPLLLGVPYQAVPCACSSPPVGCELPTGRRQRTITLPPGSRVCLFSDGLIEARVSEPPSGCHPDLLGEERLTEMFSELARRSGAPELLAAVRAAAAATPDDMAACVLGPAGMAPRELFDVEELELDARAITNGHLASYLRASGFDEELTGNLIAQARLELTRRHTALLRIDRSGGTALAELRDRERILRSGLTRGTGASGGTEPSR